MRYGKLCVVMLTAGALAANAAVAETTVVKGGDGSETVHVGDANRHHVLVKGMLRAHGPGKREKVSYLGVSVTRVAKALRKHLKLPRGTGLAVGFLEDKSPAATAGIRKEDLLMRLDDQILINSSQLRVLVRMHKPGETVKLHLIREGRRMTVPITLAEKEVFAHEDNGRENGPFRQFPYPLRSLRDLYRMKIKGPKGKVILDWPAEMEKKLKKMPDRIRSQIRTAINRNLESLKLDGPAAEVRSAKISLSDGKHRMTLTVRNGRKHLSVADRNGKVIYDGAIETDQQRRKLPADVRAKLETLERNTSVEGGKILLRRPKGNGGWEVEGLEIRQKSKAAQ